MPSSKFDVIGLCMDLSAFPNSDIVVRITLRRIQSLVQLVEQILRQGRLSSGQAASLTGKLGFAITATFGRVGRARMRPLFRRAYSNAVAVNEEIKSCLLWWLQFFRNYRPRPVPAYINSLPYIVSYSDGEGQAAGVGVAASIGGMATVLGVTIRLTSRAESRCEARGAEAHRCRPHAVGNQ